MTISRKTIGRIETLVAVTKMSATEHKMLLRIVEDAVAEAMPAATQGALVMIPADWPQDYFERFYSRYPNKKAPDRARKALDKVAQGGKIKFSDLMNGLERYIVSRDVQRGFVQHPASWINGGCWKNQEQTTPLPVERPKSFLEAALDFDDGTGSYQNGH